MAISKYLIKQNHLEAVYRITNDASGVDSVTIDLDVDLLKSNEELSGATPTVNISGMEASIEDLGEVTITRNSKILYTLFENTNAYTNVYGADSENNTFDVVIAFTKKGTVTIRLLKIKGYRPLFRPEQGITP